MMIRGSRKIVQPAFQYRMIYNSSSMKSSKLVNPISCLKSRLLISACLFLTTSAFLLKTDRKSKFFHTALNEGPESSSKVDKFAGTSLYPPIKFYHKDLLQVSNIHKISYSIYGNPNGKPVLFVHGGPGGGTDPAVSLHKEFNILQLITTLYFVIT